MNELYLHGLIGGGGGSNIKSIQRGEKTVQNGLTFTIPIDEVNLDNSVVLINYGPTNTTYPKEFCVAVEFVNATSIRLRRLEDGNTSRYIEVSWLVVEFENVKSKQSGSLTVSGTASATVTEINPSKALLFSSHTSNNGYVYQANYIPQVGMKYAVASSTSLSFKSSGSGVAYWQLIEFN